MPYIIDNLSHTFDSVRHLILDEADRLLDPEFLEQVKEIVVSCTHPKLHKAIFSATLPSGAESIAMKMLQDPIRVVVGLKCVRQYLLVTQSVTNE